jgi:hypothetical protein
LTVPMAMLIRLRGVGACVTRRIRPSCDAEHCCTELF